LSKYDYLSVYVVYVINVEFWGINFGETYFLQKQCSFCWNIDDTLKILITAKGCGNEYKHSKDTYRVLSMIDFNETSVDK